MLGFEPRWPTPVAFQLAEAAWVRTEPVIAAFAAIPAAALGSRMSRTDRATTKRELMPQCDQVLVTLNKCRFIGFPYASFTALRHAAAILEPSKSSLISRRIRLCSPVFQGSQSRS